MKLLPSTATQAQIITAAHTLGLELETNNTMYHLWRGDTYVTGAGDLSVITEFLNTRIESRNMRAEERREQQAKDDAVTAGYTLAAVLDETGAVVFECWASPSARIITLAHIDGGRAFNKQERKLSRSARNLKRAAGCLRLSATVIDKDVYYSA